MALAKEVRAAAEAAGQGELDRLRDIASVEPSVVLAGPVLHRACWHGQADVVRFLLESGADPNRIDGSAGHRPLDRTCTMSSGIRWTAGHAAVVELLLQAGADLRGRGRHGLTAVALAAWHGDREPYELLRSLGAHDPEDLDEALCVGDAPTAAGLLAGAPHRAVSREGGLTPLGLVASSRAYRIERHFEPGLAACAELLLGMGANVDGCAWDEEGSTSALAAAAAWGPPAVAVVLLEHGARDPRAFLSAVFAHRFELLDDLPAEDWQVDHRLDDAVQNTLLGDLVRYGRLQGATWLLDHGADPRLADNRGWTPLHYAARRGVNPEFVERLLAAGADPCAVTADGRTPLDVAREAGRTRIVAVLTARR